MTDYPPPPPRGPEPPRETEPIAPSHPPAPRPKRRRGGAGRFLLRLALALAVMGLLGLAGLIALSWLLLEPVPPIEEGTWLEVFFTEEFPEEHRVPHGLLGSLRDEDLSAQELREALSRARDDRRIEGVLLRPDGFAGGWAQAQEIRDGLAAVREAGKQVWSYVETPGSVPYYLASAAESVAMAPEGSLLLVGLQSRLVFLKGTLDKLGIAADFIAVGEYKSAPEQLTRSDPTEPNREQVAEYLDDVYEVWIDAMASDRGLTRERMSMLVDHGLFDVETALAEGLIDAVLDEPAVWRRVQPDVQEPLRVNVREYLAAASSDAETERYGSLAFLYATGTIVTGSSGPEGVFGGRVLGSDTLIERLERARKDEDVKAVVVRVDSPGGSAVASDLIHREVLRVREKKPVVVTMGNVAASGGYYLAMSADRILADPLSLTGSIGVYAGKLDMGGLYDKIGLSHEVLLRGENADLFSDLKPFSRLQRRRLGEKLEAFYGRFVARVAEHRELGVDEVDRVARGRVWSGRRSVEAGLVDDIGGVEEAILVAKELAGIPRVARVPLRTYQPSLSWLQRALRQLLGEPVRAAASPETAIWRHGLDLWRAAALTLDGSPQFHVPWRLCIE